MPATYPLTIYYDDSCPLCALEMDVLRRRDASSRLQFVDISAPSFDAGGHGFVHADLDAVIHAVRPDGTVLRGMDVLRPAYAAAGLRGLLAPTRWPVLKPVFDAVYVRFARRRHAISRALGPLLRGLRARRARARGRAA